MSKISVCIISFQEEAKIEACLESVSRVADEIVVVDSNSTDGTVAIAERFTDKIYLQKFLGYMEQKEFATSKATHDWILSIDCDERLSPELEASILSNKESLGEVSAYRMARKVFYVYRWLNYCWYPGYKLRLFHRDRCHWGGSTPHDHVIVDEGIVNTLKGDILHYSFDSISDHLNTIDRFTDIAAEDLLASGRKVGVLSPLLHACGAFIKLYFLQRGVLDGLAGLSAALLSGLYAFLKYSKVLMHRWKED